MSSVHGNIRVGDQNNFQVYHEGPLQINSMVNSGMWLVVKVSFWDDRVIHTAVNNGSQLGLRVIYAHVHCHISATSLTK